jgi:hypothetical protein
MFFHVLQVFLINKEKYEKNWHRSWGFWGYRGALQRATGGVLSNADHEDWVIQQSKRKRASCHDQALLS